MGCNAGMRGLASYGKDGATGVGGGRTKLVPPGPLGSQFNTASCSAANRLISPRVPGVLITSSAPIKTVTSRYPVKPVFFSLSSPMPRP